MLFWLKTCMRFLSLKQIFYPSQIDISDSEEEYTLKPVSRIGSATQEVTETVIIATTENELIKQNLAGYKYKEECFRRMLNAYFFTKNYQTT